VRKCIEVTVQGLRLRGVVHTPSQTAPGFDNLAVVMLHPGFLPRSGVGDAVVGFADGLARVGVMTVRMDLPGLGDSEGDLAETAVDFIGVLQEGGYATSAWECVQAVKAHLGLRRVVIGGYCGGAITGLFMAAAHKQELPAAMFALETSFKLVSSAEPAAANGPSQAAPAAKRTGTLRLLKSEADWWLSSSKMGRGVLKLYRAPRALLRRRASAQAAAEPQLPAGTNVLLMKAIDELLSVRLPLLFVTAGEGTGEFDYVEHALKCCPGTALHRRIKATDHSLAEGEGPAKVLEYVTTWLLHEFGEPGAPRPHAPLESVGAAAELQ
jgi:pimeloyl-ACP methyl ester carboxylesterase